MSRELTSTTLDSLDDDVVYPFFAVELLFDGGATIRMWTGLGETTIGGETFLGLGDLLNISAIQETAEMAVKGATITLSGVSTQLVSLALGEPYQGRVCNIYFGVRGDSTFNQLFSGYMDQMNIQDGPESSTIELLVENRLIDLERARVARFTSGYQKSLYAGDKGLDFIEDLQSKDIVWGRKTESNSDTSSRPPPPSHDR
jgi:hypothetical protein